MQPISIYQSTIHDGPFPLSSLHEDPLHFRQNFLQKHRLTLEQSVLVRVDYATDDFTGYRIVDDTDTGDGLMRPSSFSADTLFTKNRNVALFLHLADCVGAVVYDAQHQVLGLSHLGRHNLLQNGGVKTVEFMKSMFGTKPEGVIVFLSAAAGKQNYPLYDFENRGLHEVAVEQLIAGGVNLANIQIDERDTTIDTTLFSHSRFLKGEQATDGRHAIVAVRR